MPSTYRIPESVKQWNRRLRDLPNRSALQGKYEPRMSWAARKQFLLKRLEVRK